MRTGSLLAKPPIRIGQQAYGCGRNRPAASAKQPYRCGRNRPAAWSPSRTGQQAYRSFLIGAALWVCAANPCVAASYFVDSLKGDDNNAGTTAGLAWKTLEQANRATLKPGDRLLLAAGREFQGQLRYESLEGTRENPIMISSFADGNIGGSALINAKGYRAGIHLRNSRFVRIEGLAITANGGGLDGPVAGDPMRCGVLVDATRPGDYGGFYLGNLHVREIYYHEPGFTRDPGEVKTANGTQPYGWGMRFIVKSPGATLRDIKIADCQIEDVSHTGLKFTSPSNGIAGVEVQRLKVLNSGGPGVQMSGVNKGHFSGLYVNGSGSTNDCRNWSRGSGLWTWGSRDIVVERSQFLNANGPADSAGVHIDFNCRNVVVQHNVSANNAGGFCEVLGNNYNCAYRYNLSINDGHRVKGRNGAFQEGKTFWLSGFTGAKNQRRGPFNTYFYNNTIYAGPEITAKIAVAPTVEGVLIANNIFCFAGRSQLVLGDQFRPDTGKVDALKNVVFENNLFRDAGNWPAELVIRDRSPIIGNPEFANPGGLDLKDYVPRNASLVKDRGIAISTIPGDEVGLAIGLEVKADLLGNPIRGRPDLGAVELR